MTGLGTEILLAFGAIVLVAFLFFLVYRNYRSWDNFFVFYFLVFLIAMVISTFSRPYGSVVFGIFIVPWFLMGLLFAYLMLKVKEPKVKSKKENEELHYNDAFASGFALMTWFILYIIGIFAIVLK